MLRSRLIEVGKSVIEGSTSYGGIIPKSIKEDLKRLQALIVMLENDEAIPEDYLPDYQHLKRTAEDKGGSKETKTVAPCYNEHFRGCMLSLLGAISGERSSFVELAEHMQSWESGPLVLPKHLVSTFTGLSLVLLRTLEDIE